MAPCFEDLLVCWVPLACPGPDERVWRPLHSAATGGIDPDAPIAREWIDLAGLGQASGTAGAHAGSS